MNTTVIAAHLDGITVYYDTNTGAFECSHRVPGLRRNVKAFAPKTAEDLEALLADHI